MYRGFRMFPCPRSQPLRWKWWLATADEASCVMTPREPDQRHIGDTTVDVVGAPVGRTMTLVGVAVGLNHTPRRRGIVGLDADGVGTRPDSHNPHLEFRQRRCSRIGNARLL